MKKFNKQPNHQPKLLRKLDEEYFRRVEAIEFAVKYDDGRDPRGRQSSRYCFNWCFTNIQDTFIHVFSTSRF